MPDTVKLFDKIDRKISLTDMLIEPLNKTWLCANSAQNASYERCFVLNTTQHAGGLWFTR